MAHSQNCLRLVVGRRPEFLSMGTSPQGYLTVLIAWLLASSRVKEEKEKTKRKRKERNHILFTRSNLLSPGHNLEERIKL